MATLASLKSALRQEAAAIAPSSARRPLSDFQYFKAFEALMRGPAQATYDDFITVQLAQLLEPLFNSRRRISVLEIGPGCKSPLGSLPDRLKRKIKRYVAYEPMGIFGIQLKRWIAYGSGDQSPLPCLESKPEIRQAAFTLEKEGTRDRDGEGAEEEHFDLVLFCHSMYGMKPKRAFVERALGMLSESPPGGIVAVFHRYGVLDFDGLVCHRTASFPTGQICVENDPNDLDFFAAFIAGDANVSQEVQTKWREVCRTLGSRKEDDPNRLYFSSPETMVAFNRHATALGELIDQVPLADKNKVVKNHEARACTPAAIVRPTEIKHVEQCVQWALKHNVGLTVIGGGHSGQCLRSDVVAIDMSSFNKVHIAAVDGFDRPNLELGPLVFVEAGCTTGDVIRETMKVGLTVPLGDRPSVGMGLCLQGGIGHLSRLYGLTCDVIVGALIVCAEDGHMLHIGHVPKQCLPPNDTYPDLNWERDLLWTTRGAGTNFGVVIGITVKAFAAPTFRTQSWNMKLNDGREARGKMMEFDEDISSRLPKNLSADAFLYFEEGKLNLSVTAFEASFDGETTSAISRHIEPVWGPGADHKTLDGVELFDVGLYVSAMHGGHAGGKTSSFKRCVFLKHIGRAQIVDRLIHAIENRPSPLCYIHLLHAGGVETDIAPNDDAFGCRGWDFACVVTGVWPRDEDRSQLEASATQWVYEVVESLLPLSEGVYSADLGPDPRDSRLVAKAFGPNLPRLGRLKQRLDPESVLAYACPLPREADPKVIILVTGRSCSGKDFCANVWASSLNTQSFTARVASISTVTKREYAAATGADFDRLMHDREYKEMHRSDLTAFFQEQKQRQPRLSERHFQSVVDDAVGLDVLFVTGMREETPVADMEDLVPKSKLIEVHIQANLKSRIQRGLPELPKLPGNDSDDSSEANSVSVIEETEDHPGLTFDNNIEGEREAQLYAERHFFHLLDQDLERLEEMILTAPGFPRPEVDFQHVIGISQQPGGLELCTSLLRRHFAGDWKKVDAIASCEAGGFIFASALAAAVHLPLVLIREAGKLPPPTLSTVKLASFISSSNTASSQSSHMPEKRIELERDVVPTGGSVVVVDDVLASGETLCAVFKLLTDAGVRAEDVSVMVVAELPLHGGRRSLSASGFAKTIVQSLLVLDAV